MFDLIILISSQASMKIPWQIFRPVWKRQDFIPVVLLWLEKSNPCVQIRDPDDPHPSRQSEHRLGRRQGSTDTDVVPLHWNGKRPNRIHQESRPLAVTFHTKFQKEMNILFHASVHPWSLRPSVCLSSLNGENRVELFQTLELLLSSAFFPGVDEQEIQGGKSLHKD